MDGDRHASGRRFPPSLSALKSDFKKLCDALGGLPDIGVPVEEDYLELSCQNYPIDHVLPILLEFQKDEIASRRHWPWAAVAISQYAFERSERKYAEELTPTQILDLMKQIKEAARDLRSAMGQLEELSSRLNDPVAPFRRPHLAWLNELITQAISGRILTDVSEDPFQIVDDSKKIALLKQLADIAVAAADAMHRVDKSLLARERSPSDPALMSVISICDAVWKSLTGRTPTAERLHQSEKIHPTTQSDPDFVIFVQKLVKCAEFDPPSRKQVATSLRKIRTRRTPN